MGIEDMNNIYKQPQETPTPEENKDKNTEQKSVYDNFRSFLKLNGEKLLETGEDVELLHDTTDEVIQEMNLSAEEQDKLKSHIGNYIEHNKEGGGLDLLKDASKNVFRKHSAEKEKRKEEERRANLSPEERFTEDFSKEVSSANSPKDIHTILDNIKIIPGSSDNFSAENVKKLMTKIVNPNSDVTVLNITRTYGLREKAVEFIKHRIKNNSHTIDDLRKFLKKLNLGDAETNITERKLKQIEQKTYVSPQAEHGDSYGIVERANKIMGLQRRINEPKKYMPPLSLKRDLPRR